MPGWERGTNLGCLLIRLLHRLASGCNVVEGLHALLVRDHREWRKPAQRAYGVRWSAPLKRSMQTRAPNKKPVPLVVQIRGVVVEIDEHLTATRMRTGGGERDGAARVRCGNRIIPNFVVAKLLICCRISGNSPLDDEAWHDAVETALGEVACLQQFGKTPVYRCTLFQNGLGEHQWEQAAHLAPSGAIFGITFSSTVAIWPLGCLTLSSTWYLPSSIAPPASACAHLSSVATL